MKTFWTTMLSPPPPTKGKAVGSAGGPVDVYGDLIKICTMVMVFCRFYNNASTLKKSNRKFLNQSLFQAKKNKKCKIGY
jgi:hypothetical protein